MRPPDEFDVGRLCGGDRTPCGDRFPCPLRFDRSLVLRIIGRMTSAGFSHFAEVGARPLGGEGRLFCCGEQLAVREQRPPRGQIIANQIQNASRTPEQTECEHERSFFNRCDIRDPNKSLGL